VLVPLVVLLLGYHAAGAFYVRPDTALEARLAAIDRLVAAPLAALPPGVHALLEAAYVSVYLVIPAGAIAVAWAGTASDLDRFWSIVTVAGFVCYGALPWIQTRPPRALEAPPSPASGLRRLNFAILRRGSIGANTLPSGHAATAIATALAVWSSAPVIGAALLVVALLISIATVAGRYHYLVDTALGVLVGVGAWALIMALSGAGSRYLL
jgi:membrane-associated phospholipid phosphatase